MSSYPKKLREKVIVSDDIAKLILQDIKNFLPTYIKRAENCNCVLSESNKAAINDFLRDYETYNAI